MASGPIMLWNSYTYDQRGNVKSTRYSYVGNNPIRYNDPTGHCMADMDGPRGCGFDRDGDGSDGDSEATVEAQNAAYAQAIIAGLGGDPDENFIPGYYCSIHSCFQDGGCNLCGRFVLGAIFDFTLGPADDAYLHCGRVPRMRLRRRLRAVHGAWLRARV